MYFTIDVLWLFLTVPWVGLQCVIVVFPDLLLEVGTVKPVVIPLVAFLLTVPRQYFFCGSFYLFLFAFAFCDVCFLPVRKGLTSWLSCVWYILVRLSLSHTVPWVRCGTWFYRFLTFAFPLTLALRSQRITADQDLHYYICIVCAVRIYSNK